MNIYSDKRITQESLDLYRGDYIVAIDMSKDTILMWAALYNGEVVGMSACVVRNGKTYNSITVTDKRIRRRGVGGRLMKEKTAHLKSLGIKIETVVAADNEGSLKACMASGLKILTETTGSRGKVMVMGEAL